MRAERVSCKEDSSGDGSSRALTSKQSMPWPKPRCFCVVRSHKVNGIEEMELFISNSQLPRSCKCMAAVWPSVLVVEGS